MTRTRKPRRVKCYALAPLLTAEQLEAVRPYIKDTFRETFVATLNMGAVGDAAYEPGRRARLALYAASGLPTFPNGTYGPDGITIEAALYARAVAANHTPIMAPGRK